MKLFYNSDGKVIGSFEGASAEIEQKVSMPDTSEVVVEQELIDRLNDGSDSLLPHLLRVENDEIIVPEPNTIDTPAP